MGRRFKWGVKPVSVSVKLAPALLEFVDAQVLQRRQAGQNWDRTAEISSAIVQRRLSLMTEAERKAMLEVAAAPHTQRQVDFFERDEP